MPGRRPGPARRGEPTGSPPTARLLGVRRAVPSNRAVVGGLLVALAVVGTWTLGSGAGSPTAGVRVVVAAQPLAPGERIEAGALREVELPLPAALRDHAFGRTEQVVGQVAVGPVGAGELVQRTGVAEPAGAPGDQEVSFVVEPDWAVAGSLRPGDAIDVLATAGDGDGPSTELVLEGATVRRIEDRGDDGLGGVPAQVITIALADRDALLALTDAARSGTITVVRATGADGDGG